MKKFMSLFLILTMVLICSVPAFATFSDNAGETIIIDGSQYTIEQVVTDTYSQAIVRDSSTKVVENFIYYFDNIKRLASIPHHGCRLHHGVHSKAI